MQQIRHDFALRTGKTLHSEVIQRSGLELSIIRFFSLLLYSLAPLISLHLDHIVRRPLDALRFDVILGFYNNSKKYNNSTLLFELIIGSLYYLRFLRQQFPQYYGKMNFNDKFVHYLLLYYSRSYNIQHSLSF